MDFSDYTVDELKALRDEATEEIKNRNRQAQEEERKLKEQRHEQFAGNVNDGDTVRYLYNREEFQGTVERANEKSVSIRFETDGKIHYIPYKHVVDIVERAPQEEGVDEGAESEEDEAMAEAE